MAEGDRVALRLRLTGTNTEGFMGNPATGKAIEVHALALMRVDGDKVTELWGQFDQMTAAAARRDTGAVSAAAAPVFIVVDVGYGCGGRSS